MKDIFNSEAFAAALLRAARRGGTSLHKPVNPKEEPENERTKEENKKLEKLQKLRVKFLRIVRRLGVSIEDYVAAHTLYRLELLGGRPTNQFFSLDKAKNKAIELEVDGKDDLDFSINILVIGKCGVGKSSTINSIFGEERTKVSAFDPGTRYVSEIKGIVNGVKVKVIDTPGLKSGVWEQGYNRRILSSVKRFMKRSPPDIVLYVDRLDTHSEDFSDFPLLKTITDRLGKEIWMKAIVTLTHGASALPAGHYGEPLSYDVVVTQRSRIVQQSIHDVGNLGIDLMNPACLVENHATCERNKAGEKVLLNGRAWRPQVLLSCYSLKILTEANTFRKHQDSSKQRRLCDSLSRPPLCYLMAPMLQLLASGLKLGKEKAIGKKWFMMGKAEAMPCQGNTAYRANFELQKREVDGQVKQTFGLNLVKSSRDWLFDFYSNRDWLFDFYSNAQFRVQRNWKLEIEAGINNNRNGQIMAKISGSDYFIFGPLAFLAFLLTFKAIRKKIWPRKNDSESKY